MEGAVVGGAREPGESKCRPQESTPLVEHAPDGRQPPVPPLLQLQAVFDDYSSRKLCTCFISCIRFFSRARAWVPSPITTCRL
jgi:hypothetical protein